MRLAFWLAGLGLGVTALGACGAGSSDASAGGPGPGGGGGAVLDAGQTPSGGAGGGGKTADVPEAEPELGETIVPTLDANYVAYETLCPGADSMKQTVLDLGVGDAQSMATAGRVREALHQNRAPLPSEVRVDDLLNYYHRVLPTAAGPNLMLTLQMRPRTIGSATLADQFELLVQVDAAPIDPRPNVALTVLVDTGPAMPPEAFISAAALLTSLGKHVQPGDDVKVLTTDPTREPIQIDPANAQVELDQAAASLAASDTSDFAAGIQRAYLTTEATAVTGWRRVFYVSNGYAGHDVDPGIVGTSAQKLQDPVYLTVASVGPADAVSDGMLRKLATQGRGAYVHVDDVSEAARLYDQRFGELFGIMMDDVKVSVSLPWYLSLLDEPMAPGAPRKQYLAPGGSMRFLHRVRACAAELVNKLGALPIDVTVSATPVVPDATGTSYSVGHKVAELLGQTATTSLEELVATRAFVDALKGPTSARLDRAKSLLDAIPKQSIAGDPFQEMSDLLALHPGLSTTP